MKRILFSLSMLFVTIMAAAQVIDVKFYGRFVDVNVPSSVTDVTVTTDYGHVAIVSNTQTTEYTYRVSGTTSEGSLTISGSYKFTLQLNGVDIKSNRGAALNVACGKRIAVQLVDGTVNTFEDAAGGTQKAAMYFTGHPEIEGGGVLNVKGNTAHAISAKEYIQLKKSCGTINILGAVKDGIHCGKAKVSAWDETLVANENEIFQMNGGTINIANVGGDGIDADEYGSIIMKGGNINIDVTAADGCGLKSANTFLMTGGNININLSGQGSDGIYFNNNARLEGGSIYVDVTGNGSKAIKGKLKTTTPYTQGGNLVITDAEVDIIARGGDAVKADTPDDPSHCVGISIDGNLTCPSALSVKVLAVGDEAKAYTCDGTFTGAISAMYRQWYVNPHDYHYTASLYAVAKGFTAPDYEDYDIAAFVGDECRGTLEYNADGYGFMTLYTDNVSSTKETLTFRLYQKSTKTVILAKNTTTFASGDVIGTPSSPFVILFDPPYLRGDVNLDGLVNISDVTALVNIILGKSAPTPTSNVNEAGGIDISDVTALVNIILGK